MTKAVFGTIGRNLATETMAKDLFHYTVRQALLKKQWVITADPLIIKVEGVKLELTSNL